jgi:hypothetical protein
MSNGTPIFLITDAGLAAASVAMPQGPYIHITSFEIGSAYGYTPQETDTGLNGTLLYTGVPTSYEYVGNNTLNIICEIPPDAGPFQFGEVALFLDGGVMFAKAVFDLPQTKFSSLGTNVVSSYTLNCLLKLQQSTAVFQIDTINAPPGVVDVFQWSDVFPPGISANPDVPLYVVRELSGYGDSTVLSNTSDATWSVASTYMRYNAGPVAGIQNAAGQYTVVNATTSWVQIAASALHSADLIIGNRGFLLETPDGFFRSVNNVVVSGANYQFNLNVTNDGTYNNSPLLNAPAVGSKVILYRVDRAPAAIYYAQIVDPPAAAPLATVGTPGLSYGSSGLYMPSAGVVEAFGFLHSPSTNTGRILTSSDDLDNTALPSGLYIVSSGDFGFPANMPVSYDGHIWIHNLDGLITEVYWPAGTGGGTSPSGDGGYPPYFRSWQSTEGFWTDWFPFNVTNKLGAESGTGTLTVTGGLSTSFSVPSVPARAHYHFFAGDANAGSNSQLTHNGTVVSHNTKGGSAGYGRINHDMTFAVTGDSLTWTAAQSGGTLVVFTF